MTTRKSVRIISIVILALISPYIIAQSNLLANPDMEEAAGDTVAGWSQWEYNRNSGQFLQASDVSHSGNKSAKLVCPAENDARFVQSVNVKSDTLYRIAGWIKTENVGEKVLGANLSLLDTFIVSQDVKGTSNDWVYVELFVRTDASIGRLTVGAGIGGYGNVNTGTAYFDGLSMTEADSTPPQAVVYEVKGTGTEAENTESGNQGGAPLISLNLPDNMYLYFIWAGLAVAAFAVFFVFMLKNPAIFLAVYGGLASFASHIFIPPAGEYKGIRRVTGSPYTRPLFFLAAFVILGVPYIWDIGRSLVADPNSLNVKHYVYLAQSILQGRLDSPVYQDDMAVFQGKYWVIYPPFPVIFVIPFVAIFGQNTNMMYIGIALAIWSIVLLLKILKKVEAEPKSRRWIILAFVFGTGYWLCLRNTAGVCWYAHVASVLPLLLALNESLGKSRGILVGLFIGCAFLSRQFTIFFFPFLLVALWISKERKNTGSRLFESAMFGVGLAACAGVYLWFNWARFGNPLDTGYAYLKLGGILEERVRNEGLFSLSFLPFNAVYMFLQGFHVNYGDWPTSVTNVHQYWPMDPYGTSIVAASPFIFFAFKAKWDKRLLIAMWASIVFVALGGLLYYNNGWVQYNAQRFAVDFFPALMILVALGVKHVPEQYWKPLVVYAVFMNAVAMLVIPTAG